jgi:hypothetical protein
MAVAVVIDFPGGTLDQYDQVIGKMGFTPGGAGAPAGLFHWVTATESGIRVTDVWKTKEDFEAFAQEKIGPITAEVGLGPPQITFHEVHNHLTAG